MSNGVREVSFTVIIPTRNRPELCKLALDSVVAQSFLGFEVIVVNDGSTDEFLPSYKAMESHYGDNVSFYYQPSRPNGHGQSYSMNTGAYAAKGQYLCFLDDDDWWTDTEHLQRAYNTITHGDEEVDAYYSNQAAYYPNGEKKLENVWVEDLAEKLTGRIADEFVAYKVDAEFLFLSQGFAHLNCSIVRRDLYLSIKGMDENIRYECDRDIYIPVVDAAKTLFYSPMFIARHNIPNPQYKDNMSTLVSYFEKQLYRTMVYEKAVVFSRKPCIKRNSEFGLATVFKHSTEEYIRSKKWSQARIYARKALAVKFSFKWWLFTLFVSARSLFD